MANKLTLKQLTEFLYKFEHSRLEYPDWREGQRFFNLLNEYYNELSEEIRGTEVDPFYNDKNIKYCISYILE